ncbi:hypothetical protein SDC9_71954 [bioreactor metagenome]|uniref:Uncharacterized protein n=1 Tax=bioreactor metagenome TaxID=1076179 RepID=A0A644YAE7_9ZZZZ
MSESLFIVWILFILAIAGGLIYAFFKRKTDVKALRFVYITSSFGAIICAVWLALPRFITISDAVDDWFLYSLITILILILLELTYGVVTKKDKTPQQKKQFKFILFWLILMYLSFGVVFVLIVTG